MMMVWLTGLLTMCLMGLAMLGLAVGLLLKGNPLKGSCGGLNAIGFDGKCKICGVDRSDEDTCKAPATGSTPKALQKYDPRA